jgi:hypothetical protein
MLHGADNVRSSTEKGGAVRDPAGGSARPNLGEAPPIDTTNTARLLSHLLIVSPCNEPLKIACLHMTQLIVGAAFSGEL